MKKHLILIGLCLVMAVMAHKTSIACREQEKMANNTARALDLAKRRTNVLEADWVYMNRLERLDTLAQNYSTLKPVKADQVIQFSANKLKNKLEQRGFYYKVAMNIVPSRKPGI